MTDEPPVDPDRKELIESHKEMKLERIRKEAKAAIARNEQPNNGSSEEFSSSEMLLTSFDKQTGMMWRSNKIKGIWQAIKEGHSPPWIITQMRLGGTTEKKARELYGEALDLADKVRSLKK